ncbi:MAG: hypothetical protein AVDCRST_MAG50-779, partial [uncultured Acidimicrobiales bacterium]
ARPAGPGDSGVRAGVEGEEARLAGEVGEAAFPSATTASRLSTPPVSTARSHRSRL